MFGKQMQTLRKTGLPTVVKSLNVDEDCRKISPGGRDATRLSVHGGRYGGHRSASKMDPGRLFFCCNGESFCLQEQFFLPSHGQLPWLWSVSTSPSCKRKKSSSSSRETGPRRHRADSTDWLVRAGVTSLVWLDEVTRMRSAVSLPDVFGEL